MISCYHSDVWKMYLSKGQFDLAKKYCKVGVYIFVVMVTMLMKHATRATLLILMKFSPNKQNMNFNKESTSVFWQL